MLIYMTKLSVGVSAFSCVSSLVHQLSYLQLPPHVVAEPELLLLAAVS
jgi:hypothetical protein